MAAGIDAVFITHQHRDHIGSVRLLSQGRKLPARTSQGTFEGFGSPNFADMLNIAGDFTAFAIGDMCVTPLTVSHDARDPRQWSPGARITGVSRRSRSG